MLILTLSKLDLKLWIWPTTFLPFTNLLWKHFCMYSKGLQMDSKTGCANPVVLFCSHTSWAGSMKARLRRWWPLPDDHLLHCNTWKAQHITTPSKPSHRSPPMFNRFMCFGWRMLDRYQVLGRTARKGTEKHTWMTFGCLAQIPTSLHSGQCTVLKTSNHAQVEHTCSRLNYKILHSHASANTNLINFMISFCSQYLPVIYQSPLITAYWMWFSHTFQVSPPSCTPWYAWTVHRPFGCWLHRNGANSEEQREMKKTVKRLPHVLRKPCVKLESEQWWNPINMVCTCPG